MTLPFKSSSSPSLFALAGLFTLAALGACSSNSSSDSPAPPTAPPEPAPKFAAEIRRTSFGVPHIKANDEAGIGYGVGYAYAQDNFCLLADEIVTVNGERSKYFGPTATRLTSDLPNLQTDFFYRAINDAEAVSQAWQAHTAPMKELIEGYVAGYNTYLEQTGVAKLPAECKDGAWVRKLTENDMVKLLRRYAAEASSGQLIGAVVAAQPPAKAGAAAKPDALAAAPVVQPALDAMTPAYWTRMRERTGSNAVALGKDASENGQGMLLGNPHFPWYGALRFYQLHLTIPGKLDAMGASIGGMPMVNIGFNKDLAWTHTVNNSAHFTVHALQLDPADPTKYLVDGERKSMTVKTISVDVKGADGSIKPVSRDFYSSQFGMLMTIPGKLDWTAGVAYALNDANLGNHRMLEQWSALNRAGNLDDFKGAVDRVLGLPWVNTVAVDKEGATLFMDVTVVPNVPTAMLNACVPPPFKALAAQGLFVLSGTTAACAPLSDAAAPQRGVFAGASLPRLQRSDFVLNSNDSAWLSNPAAPLTGFPAIVSADNYEQMGRTRLGITQLKARLDGSDGLPGKKLSLSQLQGYLFSNRVYYATQVMDDVLRACDGAQSVNAEDGTPVDLAPPCLLLRAWDRSANLDSNAGYVYFTGLWTRLVRIPGIFAVPFNPADPVNTPRGLNIDGGAMTAAIRQALASSVLDATRQGIAPTSRWGQVQVAVRGPKMIPIAGGQGEFGIYNAMTSVPIAPGLRNVVYGTSYVQTVVFDKNGPQVQAFLSYSQSSDPASPWYADQTERFSQKAWITQAFTEAQITADPAYKTVSISQKLKSKN